ncbi:MAG: flavin reductase family protein [Anaerolineales bacterium]|nr:flavin reductase family protein [Anaerolineales bacterium]
MPPDPRAFRNTIGLFATGVTVIVTQVGDEVHAMTANAVSSLSLDPMLLLFCPSKKARLSQLLGAMTGFSVNILRDEQQALSTYFAGGWKEPTPPPFRFVPAEAAPRLEGSLASIHCEKHQVVDGGDHWIVIGRVVALHQGVEPRRPLLFYGGQYRSVDFTAGAPAPDLTNVMDEPAYVYYE